MAWINHPLLLEDEKIRLESLSEKECKFLLLQHCFEEMKTICIYLGTLDTNLRSRGGIESIGAKYEGTFRNRMTWNGIKRNAVIYSIIDEEWPEVKEKLGKKMN